MSAQLTTGTTNKVQVCCTHSEFSSKSGWEKGLLGFLVSLKWIKEEEEEEKEEEEEEKKEEEEKEEEEEEKEEEEEEKEEEKEEEEEEKEEEEALVDFNSLHNPPHGSKGCSN